MCTVEATCIHSTTHMQLLTYYFLCMIVWFLSLPTPRSFCLGVLPFWFPITPTVLLCALHWFFFFFWSSASCLDIMDIVFFPLPTLSPRSFFSLGLLSGYISFVGVRLLLSVFLPLRWEVIILYLAQNRDMFAFHA
jgi:hypothetical protein